MKGRSELNSLMKSALPSLALDCRRRMRSLPLGKKSSASSPVLHFSHSLRILPNSYQMISGFF